MVPISVVMAEVVVMLIIQITMEIMGPVEALRGIPTDAQLKEVIESADTL